MALINRKSPEGKATDATEEAKQAFYSQMKSHCLLAMTTAWR
jgi:hypothetical protein